MTSEGRYYSIPQLAAYLGCTYSWAYDLVVKAKAIPCIHIPDAPCGKPGYLVAAREVYNYNKRKRSRGRPRISDRPSRGKSRLPVEVRQQIVASAVLRAFMDRNGRYPTWEEIRDGKLYD